MSESHQIKGRIVVINEKQTFASGFEKQEFVIDDMADKYPQQIKLEAVKDLCATVAGLSVGDQVSVEFNLRGNEYNGKYYVNLQAWKIEVTAPAQSAPVDDPLDEEPDMDCPPPF